MSTLAKSATICLLAGSTFTLAAAPATAQQDAEAIRGKCIAQASKSFPGTTMEGPADTYTNHRAHDNLMKNDTTRLS